ncbi:MAG: hypothetical protein DHS20C18_18590 [Saprospiraceae bacterium]|nr:MAG: hypothetical protein DHS20C18_18590 [Saprospiraceae bacterium]
MEAIAANRKEQNRKKGMRLSILVHILLIILALIPLMTYPDPPPGQEGILVNLGLPDQGQGDENAGPAEPEQAEEVTPEEETAPEEVVEETIPETKPEPVKEKEKEVVKTEDPDVIALKKKKAQEEARKKADAEAKKKAEDEAKRKAQEEARKKAEADAKKKAEADALKDQIGGLFGDGKGKGNTGTSGNQGDPNGDPNSDNLEGISKGSGNVGGGLGNRGVRNAPAVSENSQQAGTVVVSVCVDIDGNVVSAEYTQRGSTTGNSQLKNAAIRNARQWTFSKGSQEKQCGTITYKFKVQ